MKGGNWIPLSKGLVYHLPKNRAYTKLEAAYSLQFDYDQGGRVTVTGYANLWRWSKDKVYRFLNEMNVQIQYPEDTAKTQKQTGLIKILSPYQKPTENRLKSKQKPTENRLKRCIDSKKLDNQTDRKPTDGRQKTDRRQVATKDPKSYNTNSRPLGRAKNPCPHDTIVGHYHDILPELPRIRVWSEKRKRYLEARWNDKLYSNDGLKSNTLEFWKQFFYYIRDSDFLMGQKTDFKANLEWIVTKSNFIKIVEGFYHK